MRVLQGLLQAAEMGIRRKVCLDSAVLGSGQCRSWSIAACVVYGNTRRHYARRSDIHSEGSSGMSRRRSLTKTGLRKQQMSSMLENDIFMRSLSGEESIPYSNVNGFGDRAFQV